MTIINISKMQRASLIWLILSPAPYLRAEILGERELLRLVAFQNKANLDALRTWQGDVEFVHNQTNLPKSQVQVSFAYDREAKKYAFLARELSHKEKNTPKGKENEITWGGIRTPDGFFRMNDRYPHSDRDAKLTISQKSPDKAGDFSAQFYAPWYFQIKGDDVYERLMFLHDQGNDPASATIKVSQKNNRVIVLLERPKEAYNRYVFDLDQGANLVEFVGEDSDVKGEHNRTYNKVSNVWVPALATSKNTQVKTGTIRERKTTWTKNIVNEPVSPENFQPEKLGITKGDLVRDTRTGVEYHFDRDGSVPLTSRRWFWPTVVVTSLVVLAASVIHFGRRFQRNYRVRSQS